MVISIANNKGGTGKTTTAVNLGAALQKATDDFVLRAEKDLSILLVDLDPQGNLSINLGVSIDELSQTIYDVLLNPESIQIKSVIISGLKSPEPAKDLDLAPANIDLSGATVELMNEISRETILKRTLLSVKEDYQFLKG